MLGLIHHQNTPVKQHWRQSGCNTHSNHLLQSRWVPPDSQEVILGFDCTQRVLGRRPTAKVCIWGGVKYEICLCFLLTQREEANLQPFSWHMSTADGDETLRSKRRYLLAQASQAQATEVFPYLRAAGNHRRVEVRRDSWSLSGPIPCSSRATQSRLPGTMEPAFTSGSPNLTETPKKTQIRPLVTALEYWLHLAPKHAAMGLLGPTPSCGCCTLWDWLQDWSSPTPRAGKCGDARLCLGRCKGALFTRCWISASVAWEYRGRVIFFRS